MPDIEAIDEVTNDSEQMQCLESNQTDLFEGLEYNKDNLTNPDNYESAVDDTRSDTTKQLLQEINANQITIHETELDEMWKCLQTFAKLRNISKSEFTQIISTASSISKLTKQMLSLIEPYKRKSEVCRIKS